MRADNTQSVGEAGDENPLDGEVSFIGPVILVGTDLTFAIR